MRGWAGRVLPHFNQLSLVARRREQDVRPKRQRLDTNFPLLAVKFDESGVKQLAAFFVVQSNRVRKVDDARQRQLLAGVAEADEVCAQAPPLRDDPLAHAAVALRRLKSHPAC